MTDSFAVRRVVTGHDASGRAIIVADDVVDATSPRPGQAACVLWTTGVVPADNDVEPLPAATSRIAGGAAFRLVRYAAHSTGTMHRTQTQDWAIVLSGSIDLRLDDETEVTLAAGDTLVQRGTYHQWINRDAVPCVVAFVVIDAESAP